MNTRIAVIGLGYVGLPLALAFARHFAVTGFDIQAQRVAELMAGNDRTLETNPQALQAVVKTDNNDAHGLFFTTTLADLQAANIFIITVPTPVDRYNAPDLRFLLQASEMTGQVLQPGDIVIYESTVYPGCTEEECVPVLEKTSGLVFNKDFYVGYSPERINPGDKVNTLANIKKVTSGSTPAAAERIDDLYSTIITAGTHKAPNIKVAEASKAIENAQRDVNISFVNELALIFDRIGIDTNDVLAAAGTKWNFLQFRPGLVGGHCISVDPYYLAHKASALGYHPQVILSGRRVNDMMGAFIAGKVVKLMIKKGHTIKGSRALLLGIAFKENCADTRNSKVIDIYHELEQFGVATDVYDPLVSKATVKKEFGIELVDTTALAGHYEAIILAVAHEALLSFDFWAHKKNNAVIFDVQGRIGKELADARL